MDLGAIFRGEGSPSILTGNRVIVIETESYDNPSGRMNDLAMNSKIGGYLSGVPSDQLRIWELYLTNMLNAYSRQYGASKAGGFMGGRACPYNGGINPWRSGFEVE